MIREPKNQSKVDLAQFKLMSKFEKDSLARLGYN